MKHERSPEEWYVDPPFCTELLLDAVPFRGSIWDPCAGQGTIVEVCLERGLKAFGTDINPKFATVREMDFLSDHRGEADNIIFNPPYNQAEDFIRRAIALARRRVAVLLQQQFPYSQGRHRLFTEHKPAQMLFLSSRPSMPPGRLMRQGMKQKGGKTDYLWIVWDREHTGATTCDWLLRPEHAKKGAAA